MNSTSTLGKPKITPAFQQLYKKLNMAQKQAVGAIEGPVMVVAGPGTGKTQILTLRIANILQKTDTPPDAILALTFTESAVAAMRRRLVSIIGSSGYRVKIHTFHSFCNDVIDRWPDEFPRIIGADPIADIERIEILREIIASSSFEHLKPFGDTFYYVTDLRGKISELKRENISPEKFEVLTEEAERAFNQVEDLFYESGRYAGRMKGKYQGEAKRVARARELASVYRAYEEALRERRRYDFEDMIVEVVSALERDEDLLLRIQEEYLYVLADEHQDANTAQNRLLELLTSFHENPNIFVVGDEKQAIFRFQGASLENFLYFKKLYSDASLVTLTESYRSGQGILDSAHSIMSSSPHGASPDDAAQADDAENLRVPLISRAGITGEVVEVRAFSTGEVERAWIAEAIERQIGEGVEPSEIAVLYRTNKEAEGVARALETRGLTVSIESDQNVLADPDIRKLIVLLSALAYFGEDERLAVALHLPFLGVAPLDFYKIARLARRDNHLLADVIGSEKLLTQAKVHSPKALVRLYRNLEQWASASPTGDAVPTLVDDIIRDSGFLSYVLNSDRQIELLEKLAGFIRSIEDLAAGRPDYTLKDLVSHLALLEEYRIPIRKETKSTPRAGAVLLMTAHRSKGLEFDYVYIAGAADGTWGGRRERDLFGISLGGASGSDEDERRLFYVALTRARLGVFMSHPQESASGKELLPSRFIEEMNPDIVRLVDTAEDQKRLANRFTAPPPRRRARKVDSVFLNELFADQGLSVTALNNYLACPWRYFYSNLVRIPKTPTKHMLFGTAVHQALNEHFRTAANGKGGGVKQFLKVFEEKLGKLPLSRRELEELQNMGQTALLNWFEEHHPVWGSAGHSEYRVSVNLPLSDGPLSALKLRGDLDRMETLEGSAVRVTDFKTGRPKSRNAILGNTKSDTGDYWRQLVFYKLLLDLEGKYSLREGVIDFVQPDPSGKYRREVFEVTKEDTDQLIETIEQTTREIHSLSFWDQQCGDGKCEYCRLRELME